MLRFTILLLALVSAALAWRPWPSFPSHHLWKQEPQPEPRPLEAHLYTKEYWVRQAREQRRKLCFFKSRGHGRNDASVIVRALNRDCKSNSLIVFPSPLYTILIHLVTPHLHNVHIVQLGKMVWTNNIEFWQEAGQPIGFQNQTAAWVIGGDHIVWDGYGVGTMDGNGQMWYDWAKGVGNKKGRPMNINFRNVTNSVFTGLRFVQSQMWTMAITNSQNVEFSDIYINSTSSSEHNTINTDGADTINSDNITFRRWFVTNGDDAIALKGNSTNISIYDSVFENGQGIAIGSLAQYNNTPDYIENFYAKNITFRNTAHVSYLKTWAGNSRGYPPNGGGGGYGYARNITIEDVKLENGRQEPFFAWQCENYQGFAGQDCNSSKFKFENVAWRNVSGTVRPEVQRAAYFQCSAAAGGCDNITVEAFDVRQEGNEKILNKWFCENVNGAKGFKCNEPMSNKTRGRLGA